jgi:hypothetical protein
MWAFHNFAIVQHEGGKLYTYQTNPLQRKNSLKTLVLFVQMSSSKMKYSTYERIKSLQGTRFDKPIT